MRNVTALILLGEKKKNLKNPSYNIIHLLLHMEYYHQVLMGAPEALKAGLITHLPSKICARQTCGTAPLIATLAANV